MIIAVIRFLIKELNYDIAYTTMNIRLDLVCLSRVCVCNNWYEVIWLCNPGVLDPLHWDWALMVPVSMKSSACERNPGLDTLFLNHCSVISVTAQNWHIGREDLVSKHQGQYEVICLWKKPWTRSLIHLQPLLRGSCGCSGFCHRPRRS